MEPLPDKQNVEEPPIHQVNGEEKEGNDNQADPSQKNMDEDDDTEDSEHHPSTQPQTGQCTQTLVPPKEAQSSHKS